MPADLRDLFEFGPFTLDGEDGSLTRAGEVIPLSRLAADVLIVLLENPGRVFPLLSTASLLLTPKRVAHTIQKLPLE